MSEHQYVYVTMMSEGDERAWLLNVYETIEAAQAEIETYDFVMDSKWRTLDENMWVIRASAGIEYEVHRMPVLKMGEVDASDIEEATL